MHYKHTLQKCAASSIYIMKSKDLLNEVKRNTSHLTSRV